jgi:pimeloyl-ACP methyl ester carboxylesterase
MMSVLAVLLLAGSARAGSERLDKEPSRYARFGEVKVHYKSLGTGKKAVVLIHGWTSDLTFWSAQVPALEGKTRVVLIDLPGHGKSDKPKTKYTMDYFARAVDAVLADAGIEEAILAGHSMGTPVARQYYRLFPKKVRALVAVDGGVRRIDIPEEQLKKFLALFKGPDYEKNITKFLETMLPKGAADLAARVKRSTLNTPQHVAASAMEEMMAPEVWKEDRIEVPFLAIMAESPFWGEDYQKFVRKLAPKSEYHVMKGVSHFLHLEQPKAFNKILTDFLRKQGFLTEPGRPGAEGRRPQGAVQGTPFAVATGLPPRKP